MAKILRPCPVFGRRTAQVTAKLRQGMTKAVRLEIGQPSPDSRLLEHLAHRAGIRPAFPFEARWQHRAIGTERYFRLWKERIVGTKAMRPDKLLFQSARMATNSSPTGRTRWERTCLIWSTVRERPDKVDGRSRSRTLPRRGCQERTRSGLARLPRQAPGPSRSVISGRGRQAAAPAPAQQGALLPPTGQQIWLCHGEGEASRES